MFTDNFNRADENLVDSANWTRVGGADSDIRVVSNECDHNTTNSTGTAL